MALPNLGAMRAVADRLDQLGIPYAFVGGSIVNLLLDNPTVSPARPTDDVDVIIELVSSARYSDIEAKLRTIGFDHDMSEGAPKCRWVLGELLVDIMPTDGSTIGLNTAWFTEALATAAEVEFAHSRFRLISPTAFIALKYGEALGEQRVQNEAPQHRQDEAVLLNLSDHCVFSAHQSPFIAQNALQPLSTAGADHLAGGRASDVVRGAKIKHASSADHQR